MVRWFIGLCHFPDYGSRRWGIDPRSTCLMNSGKGVGLRHRRITCMQSPSPQGFFVWEFGYKCFLKVPCVQGLHLTLQVVLLSGDCVTRLVYWWTHSWLSHWKVEEITDDIYFEELVYWEHVIKRHILFCYNLPHPGIHIFSGMLVLV